MKLSSVNPFCIKQLLAVAGFFAMSVGAQAAATNGTWLNTGATNGNWSTGTNWTGGTVAGSTSTTTDTGVATFNTAVGTFGTTGSPILIDSTTQDIGGISFDTAAGNYFIGTTGGNTLKLTTAGTIQILNTLSSTNAVETINVNLSIQAANGTYTFANNSANGTGVGAGTLNFGGTISGAVAGATVLTLNGTNTNANTISGNISNGTATTLGITKAAAGTWVLSGANTYTGTTTVSAGTLKAGVASVADTSGAFGNGSAVVVNGGTLDLNGFNTQIGKLSAAAAGGTVAVGGSALTIGKSTVNPGNVTYAGAFTGTGAGIINFTGNNATAYATAGNNSVTLSGTNTGFTGNINIAGIRVFAGTQAAAASAATLAGTSATYSVGANGQVFLGAATYNNNVSINGNGWLDAGNVTLGAIRLAGATLAGNVTLNTAATIGGASSTGTISGIISDGTGTNAMTIVAGGTGMTVTFSGANTYAGNTTVNSSATLTLGNNLALQNSAFDTASEGVVTFGAGVTAPTLGGLTGSTNLATKFTTGYTSVTSLTLNPLAGSQTYSGVIANGAMSLTKTGAGTQILSGANGYTGLTTVSGGKLTIASTGTINGTSGVSIGAGEFNYNNSTTALSQGVSFSGTGGTLSGTGTITPAVTITAGNRQTAGSSVTAATPTATVGKQTFASITYNEGSIFEWNLTANADATIGTRGTNYDAINTTALAATGAETKAIFRVVLNAGQNFSEDFWNTDRTWTDIFKTSDAGSNFDIASIFSSIQYFNASGEVTSAPTTQGSFSMSGNTLSWTAVPEPTSALAGLLLGAGLLRRRRN